MDETDLKILNKLVQKPGISLKEIAVEIGLTPPAVTHRIKRMKEDGIIKGFVPTVNLKKLGFNLAVLTNIKIKYRGVKGAASWLAKDDNVCGVYYVTGAYDFLVLSRFKNTKEFSDWIERINQPENKPTFIDRMNTSVVFEKIKEDLAPNKFR